MAPREIYQPALNKSIERYFGRLDPEALQALKERLEWVEIQSGATLMRIDDPADGMYFLLMGRLAVFQAARPGEDPQFVTAIHKSECVGEMALLANRVRNANVIASRDSVLVKIRQEDFQAIYQRFPSLLLAFSKTLVERLGPTGLQRREVFRPHIALVPLQPLNGFAALAHELAEALSRYARAQHINQQTVARGLGLDFFDPDSPEAFAWFAGTDQQDALAVYEANPALSKWTRKCVRQADKLYLFVDAAQAQVNEELETYLAERRKKRPDMEVLLVLIHPENTPMPQGTLTWLQRLKPKAHFHIRAHQKSDLDRLARAISGKSVGLALGGGGAKALVHLGVLQALEELHICPDAVVGTGGGAWVAAASASGWSHSRLEAVIRESLDKMQATQPEVSLFPFLAGKTREDLLRLHFDAPIEDLWIPYLAVSSNLTSGEMSVRQQGPLWEAIAASSALPGVCTPVFQQGALLADGAMVNNLPCSLLAGQNELLVVAIDPRPIDGAPVYPNKLQQQELDAQVRASYLMSAKHAAAAEKCSFALIKPPLAEIGLLDWHKWEQAAEIGRRYTLDFFDQHPEKLAPLQQTYQASQAT